MFIQPHEVATRLDDPQWLIVDVGDRSRFQRTRLPGAVQLPYEALIRPQPPVAGLAPDPAELVATLAAIGIGDDEGTTVVAYDSDGCGKASRLAWTLDWLGHPRVHVVDGGLQAWLGAELPTERSTATPTAPTPAATPLPAQAQRPEALTELDWLRGHFDDEGVRLLDVRSTEEYSGEVALAERGGHIPGARHLDWSQLKDPEHAPALRPHAEIEEMLRARDIGPEHRVIVYCQSHHRSSYAYVALRTLGYRHVSAYAGSWSEWGNCGDTPAVTTPAGE
ncbi:hypothetical protein CKO15_00700 [Halorhodospira abdelmalekii]|uniref:sulfurtransferase n=1 Tax=Halorhodospira abdelmalekii TaxID=421629 RepID=UPI00190636E8|nr:rhodanese-like domain-containing protein [Halorhodospira abdelmalekii]MBK1733821.1 hypothetical protein [Halorhodospira abdelmalekii]